MALKHWSSNTETAYTTTAYTKSPEVLELESRVIIAIKFLCAILTQDIFFTWS